MMCPNLKHSDETRSHVYPDGRRNWITPNNTIGTGFRAIKRIAEEEGIYMISQRQGIATDFCLNGQYPHIFFLYNNF